MPEEHKAVQAESDKIEARIKPSSTTTQVTASTLDNDKENSNLNSQAESTPSTRQVTASRAVTYHQSTTPSRKLQANDTLAI